MNTIERLKELDAKATPGPWQTRFIYRAYSAGRDLPDLEYGTKPEQDWPDCELIAEMRNALPELLAQGEILAALAKSHEAQMEYIRKLEAVAEAAKTVSNACSGYVNERSDFGALRHALKALDERP